MKSVITPPDKAQIKHASNIALASLLNLTMLPVISFVYLLLAHKKTEPDTIDRYHADLGIKVNLAAAIALFFVCGLMIFFGGFDSAWTWVYVITYFTFVHTIFIMITVWAMIRAWNGETLKSAR